MRRLAATIAFAFILGSPAYADWVKCSDINGIYRDRGRSSLSRLEGTREFWIIPVQNSSTVNLGASLKNVLKNGFMSRVKPRVTCDLGNAPIDGHYYDTCYNSIIGASYVTETNRSVLQVPDASGQLVEVYRGCDKISECITEIDSCSSGRMTEVSIYRLHSVVRSIARDPIPYLLLDRRVSPIDVKIDSPSPSF